MRTIHTSRMLPMIAALSAGIAVLPAAAQTVVIAPSAPPPPQVEAIPAPPSQLVYWQPGHWTWSGNAWVWDAGQYVQRPQPASVWVPGHWIQEANGWSWIQGYWRS